MSATMLDERFWSKVNKNGPTMPHMDTPCWEWTGAKARGYGIFSENGSSLRAHRASLEAARGEPLGDLCALHRCDNPPCVNPDHLFVGTRVDNNRDRHSKGRSRPGTGRPRRDVEAAEKMTVWLSQAAVDRIRAEARALGPHVGAGVVVERWAGMVPPTAPTGASEPA